MEEGVIVKGIAGFYYVEDNDENIFECKARGIFRKEKLSPIVGDRVYVELLDDKHGIINEIQPRKNQLVRPLVANIDQAILVFALKKPDINYLLLDKLLILIEHYGINALICINKSDLADADEIEKIKHSYKGIGYDLIITNGKTGEGIELLKESMKGKISVFAGPSGVGKSTIFNKVQDKVVMETGDISGKVERGKHTTRHSELIKISQGTFLVDTPGFSSLDLSFMEIGDLQYSFREFAKYLGECKYSSCIHGKESGCKVKEMVEKGKITQERYNTYLGILKELQENRRKW
ncbi:MAG: rsgA [Clostridiales bacterium]|nr:rsgA [Clostridiales bacterium]